MRTLELRIPPAVLGLLLGAAMAATAHFTHALGFILPRTRVLAAGMAWLLVRPDPASTGRHPPS